MHILSDDMINKWEIIHQILCLYNDTIPLSRQKEKRTMITCKSQVRHDFFVYYYSYLFFNMERDNSIEKITIYNLY